LVIIIIHKVPSATETPEAWSFTKYLAAPPSTCPSPSFDKVVLFSLMATIPNAIGSGYRGVGFGFIARSNAIESDFQPHPLILDLAGPPDIFNFIFCLF
jgi:hypothetical protein